MWVGECLGKEYIKRLFEDGVATGIFKNGMVDY